MIRRSVSARLENLKTIYYGGGPTHVADLLRGRYLRPPPVSALRPRRDPDDRDGAQEIHACDPGWLGHAGSPARGVEVRVVDGDDVDMPTGSVGEIVTRSVTASCKAILESRCDRGCLARRVAATPEILEASMILVFLPFAIVRRT